MTPPTHHSGTHVKANDNGFAGFTVASFESRMAPEMTRLIERYGGRPLVAPALREIPLRDNSAALRFGVRLASQGVDLLILLTGVGTTALFDLLKTRHSWPVLAEALSHVTLVARGPKPVAALRALGLRPALVVPEPNTWVDVVSTLDEYRPVKGLRVAIQEYGVSNRELLEALRTRGADVFAVPIYRWAIPENLAPLRHVLDEVIAGHVSLILITNAAQVDHVMQVLETDGKIDAFRNALTHVGVASIGPTASEHLRSLDWPVDLEPSHPKMGILVKEASERARALLMRKSGR
ncbi:hypothetical protein YTPLAS18_35390 [Nitrospira sp.]|nr:hypothetical protein YTPLAS18_35390 [Nitrospira sp.]